MAWGEWHIERLERFDDSERREVERLLAAEGLGFDAPVPDLLLIARDNAGNPIGTGALAGDVVKQLVVAADWRGAGLFADLITVLTEEAALRRRHRLFVYTKPDAAQLLQGLGFRPVAATGIVSLLECGHPTFHDYLEALRPSYRPGQRVAGLVMNCNPFTRGHLHLAEAAAAAADVVHLFVVSADRSLFPAATRLQLVQAGVAHLPNVTVHAGGPYIISGATFPNYFLRQPGAATRAQAELDAVIFAQHIAPVLGINERWVGQEPLDPTTAAYNEALTRVLPAAGITVRVIDRLQANGRPISASDARQAIRTGDMALLAQLLPPSTLAFLRSPEAAAIIERIRLNETPH